ncbi:MAG: hypothetical protein RR549_01180 [Oscillospiraceae bacterium]
MIKLIVGKKGSGKTKTLIEMVNEASQNSKGNVICIEKGLKLTYDLKSDIRLIDTEEYKIESYQEFYAFICGLLAGNYDITDVFVDSIIKIAGADLENLSKVIEALNKAFDQINFVFTVSADANEIPASIKEYIK